MGIFKHLALSAAAAVVGFTALAQGRVPMSVAHRGAHIDGLVPENSVAAVAMAARYGFRAIECDVHYTADSVLVLMHDATINRTMRNASDYSEIAVPVKYSEKTCAELRDAYVLASSDPSLRTPIPTFAEELAACKEYGIIPMLHTDVVEAYRMAHDVLGDKFIAFDTDFEALKKARGISDCLILWDPGVRSAEETIAMLNEIGGRCGVSSMKSTLLTPEYIGTLRSAGFEVQSSIFPTPKEMDAIADGASIILSDFSLLPVRVGYEQSVTGPAEGAVRARQTATEQIRGCFLKAGEELSLSWEGVEYGSLETRIRYSGSLEFRVNGERCYTLTEGDALERLAGWRYHSTAPSIVVKALKDTELSLSVNVYEY